MKRLDIDRGAQKIVDYVLTFDKELKKLMAPIGNSSLPVGRSDALVSTDKAIADNNLTISPKSYDCLKGILENFDSAAFYIPACFENGYATRKVLDYDLSDKALADRAEIDAAVASGTPRQEAAAPYVTDAAFDTWYNAFCAKLESKAHP